MNCFPTFSCTYKLPNGSDGGYFNAIMSFPSNYPNSPPTVKFISKIWHPNVFTDTRVCISILHPPGGTRMAMSFIVLSIISILSSPNDESPANIEGTKFDKNDTIKSVKNSCTI
ncbi:hypothetical protein CsSME_00032013 [Camellia sinensis var. sinensis]